MVKPLALFTKAEFAGSVYESAFALARSLKEKGIRENVRITVVNPTILESELETTTRPLHS